ncbi:MAG: UDP-N-acetylmuramate dehydrogenase [Bacteroidia bacterium]
MVSISENVNLFKYNTFGINANAKFFVEVFSAEDILELIKHPVFCNNRRLILGGGSNILLLNDFDGLVIKISIKGKEIKELNSNDYLLCSGAGEVWHDLVMYSIENGLGGLENLSLIPGCVGASPMQNIGAYGVEIKDVFESLTAIDIDTGEIKTFDAVECKFGYRESVFKNELKDRYVILKVCFKLKKNAQLNTSYGAISDELHNAGITHPGTKDVSNAVIAIRKSKLPDPSKLGNAGSFFKNPEVSKEKFESLKSQFENLVAYPLDNGNYKLAAGWLIENAGLKGFVKDGAGVHEKQALVLVNLGATTGNSIYELSELVIEKVKTLYGVVLTREVNIIK